MRVSARLLQRIRFYAVMLLVAALGVRGAVPSGYMLDEAQDGRGLVIRMCGSGGNHEVYLDLTRGEYRDVKDAAAPKDPASPSKDDDQDSPCPFALNAAVDLAQPTLFYTPALFGPPQLGTRPYIREIASDPVSAPLPARGPPVLV